MRSDVQPQTSRVEREADADEPGGHRQHAGNVDVAVGLLVARLLHVAQHEEDGRDAERDVDEEHAAPVEVLRERAAHEGPGACPMADMPSTTPMARAWRAPENVLDTTAIETGKISAAPMPCTTRAMIRNHSSGALPQTIDTMPNTTSPITITQPAPEDVGEPASAVTISAPIKHVAAHHPLQVGGRHGEVLGDGRDREVEREPVHLHDQHRYRARRDHQLVFRAEREIVVHATARRGARGFA